MTLIDRRPPEPTRLAFQQAISVGAEAWYAACMRITRNEAQAQDAVQDALLNAWSKRSQFQGTARLETWIHRIAINSALALLRRQRPVSWVEFNEEIASDEPGPVQRCEDHQLGLDLEAALGELSDLERVCFSLKHLEQWRLKEIAEQLDTGVGPVKQALFRAIAKLRKSMAPIGEHDE